MISTRPKFLSLLFFCTSLPAVIARVASAEIETGFNLPVPSGRGTFGLLRKPDVFVGTTRALSVYSRELYGSQWSWSSLFFQLGICKPEHCHKGPGPCHCPNCSKPHPAIFNAYCDAQDSSSSYTADSSSSGGGEDSRAFYDDGSSGNTGNGPNATRRSLLWWLVGGAGVAATAVGAAFVMRKRTSTTVASSKGALAAGSGASSNYMLMGAAATGVGAAIAGALSKLGLKSTDDSSSTSGSSSGMVSKRIGLMQHTDELPRVDDASVAPSFIEIRSSTRGLGSETFIEELDGMEVQGPFRPSSNYAV